MEFMQNPIFNWNETNVYLLTYCRLETSVHLNRRKTNMKKSSEAEKSWFQMQSIHNDEISAWNVTNAVIYDIRILNEFRCETQTKEEHLSVSKLYSGIWMSEKEIYIFFRNSQVHQFWTFFTLHTFISMKKKYSKHYVKYSFRISQLKDNGRKRWDCRWINDWSYQTIFWS